MDACYVFARMISLDLGIIGYTERYLLARSVSRDYATALRSRVEAFCAWAKADVPIFAVCPDLVNEWLAELEESGMSVWSLRDYRGSILSVWNDAFDKGDNDHAPLRIRKFTKPRIIVKAYTHREIATLLKAAAKLGKVHSDGNKSSIFWQAAINVAYCCGPRRGDLLAVDWEQVSPDGVLAFVQHKTGFPNRAKLTREALALCRKLKGDGRLLPYPYCEDWFSSSFKKLRKSAGVMRGSFKWIRRSAGSYAELKEKGAGAKLLGHRDPTVFQRFYEDEEITGENPAEPPPIR